MHISLLPLWNAINDNGNNGNGNGNGNDDYDDGNGSNNSNNDSWRLTFAIAIALQQVRYTVHTQIAHKNHQENRCKSGKTVCYAIKVCYNVINDSDYR